MGFVWFWDKVALVFGVLTSTNRIGSVLNFLFTSRVSVDYGISWALWLGKLSTVLLITIKSFAFIKYSGEILNKIVFVYKYYVFLHLHCSLSTDDFSTLYTTLLQNLFKEKT